VSETIKGVEGPSRAELQDDPCSRHPVRVFAMNQVSDDVEDVEGIFTFISEGPDFRQISQKRIESGWSASEEGNRVLQIVSHEVKS
jgi:hypothetical protein